VDRVLSGRISQGSSALGQIANAGRMAGSAIQAGLLAAQLHIEKPATKPFPAQDGDRETRIVQDINDMLFQTTYDSGFERKVKRWISQVLAHAATRRRWKFLDAVARAQLGAGADIIDLRGHIDQVIAAFAPRRLHKASLQQILDARQAAAAGNQPNAGAPTHYAIEGGRRLHLWPAPHQATAFAVLYSRPLRLEIVPEQWEQIIVNGVLGRYGRHFDRDALSQDPEWFEKRYETDLRRADIDGWDIESAPRYEDLPAGHTLTAESSFNTARDVLVPASLTGIGYVSIETGDYLLQVNQ
jgi:hypothetical protein